MQTEKMPVLQQVIFAVGSILLIALWVSHAGDHIIVARLTVEIAVGHRYLAFVPSILCY